MTEISGAGAEVGRIRSKKNEIGYFWTEGWRFFASLRMTVAYAKKRGQVIF